jgi:hypothetical protein
MVKGSVMGGVPVTVYSLGQGNRHFENAINLALFLHEGNGLYSLKPSISVKYAF